MPVSSVIAIILPILPKNNNLTMEYRLVLLVYYLLHASSLRLPNYMRHAELFQCPQVKFPIPGNGLLNFSGRAHAQQTLGICVLQLL